MSYHRDKDAPTRGVGAIAAADMVSRARQVQRRQVAIATSARDRQMAAVANGALGLVSTAALRDRRNPMRPTPIPTKPPTTGTVIHVLTGTRGPNSTWNGYNAGTASSAPPLIRLPPAPGTPSNDPARGTTLSRDDVRAPVQSPPIIAVPTPPIVPPVASTPTTTSAPTTSSGSSTITVSGGGSPAGIPSTMVQSPPIMAPRISPIDPVTGGAPGMSDTTRNVLLIGGGLAAAWFLFGRKKR